MLNTKNDNHWRRVAAYLYWQLTKLLLTLHNINYLRKKPIPGILRLHRVSRNLRKNKDIMTKSDKGNGVVILDRKLYYNTIQKIISDNFEKLVEDPTLKREASLKTWSFLRKLKQKNFFNENKYNKSYPSGSALGRIYDTPKLHKFFSSDSFPQLR